MKQFTIENISNYLDKANAYDNPKTMKVVQVQVVSEGLIRVRAVTFPQTFIIEWTQDLVSEDAKTWIDQLEAVGHVRGTVKDVTTGPRI